MSQNINKPSVDEKEREIKTQVLTPVIRENLSISEIKADTDELREIKDVCDQLGIPFDHKNINLARNMRFHSRKSGDFHTSTANSRPILRNPVPAAAPPCWPEPSGVPTIEVRNPLSLHNQMQGNRDVQVDIKSEIDSVNTVNIRAHEGSSIISTAVREPQVHQDWFGGGQMRPKLIRIGCTHDVDGACALCHNIPPTGKKVGSNTKKRTKSSKGKSNVVKFFKKELNETKQVLESVKNLKSKSVVHNPCFVKDCPGGCGNVHPDGKISKNVCQPKPDKPLGEYTDLKDVNRDEARRLLDLDGSESGSGSGTSPSGSGSGSSTSGSSGSPPPSDDGKRPIRKINYQGHFNYDNFEKRDLSSETRVFRVPQAMFHGIVSDKIMSQSSMVQHFGFYYRLKFIDVEMPVSIVNELILFWKATVVRDVINYEKSEFLCVQLMRNADIHSKVLEQTLLLAPLLACYNSEPRNRYTTPLIYEKMWSWNFCFVLWFLFAGIDKLLYGRVYNIFWVALLFLLSLTLRFVFKSVEFENLFLRFSRLKLLLSGSFAACYLFWYLLLNAIYNSDVQYTSQTSYVPVYTNSTLGWSEVNYTSVEFGVYTGPDIFPLTITTILFIIYARMVFLYTPSFLVTGNHIAFPLGPNWARQVRGVFQIRSICSPSVMFTFLQIILYYLYLPYWLGFGLYLLMLLLNRRLFNQMFARFPRLRFLTIDAQFY
jgi:hypothetical protein